MRIITGFLSFLLFASCATGTGKERTYTGSTPAAPVVRSFLGIALADSIDFIRWQLFINDDQYHLHANYGIGKPNTNGFINDGIKIELSGKLKREKNYWSLQNGDKTLKTVELNDNLLHLLDVDNNMLVGNGGWSYTLNSLTHSVTDEVSVTAKQTALKDSMSFEGRTPCSVPGVFAPGTLCYKIKWYIVFYGRNNEPAGFKILGTRWRKEGGITGNWKISKGKNGGIIYQLNYGLSDGKGNGVLYLMKLDEGVLIFTDANGKLLVGDEDFSYTLNRYF
jgi:hypothetical protein